MSVGRCECLSWRCGSVSAGLGICVGVCIILPERGPDGVHVVGTIKIGWVKSTKDGKRNFFFIQNEVRDAR